VSAAKQHPHRPGISPALGLPAGRDDLSMISQTASNEGDSSMWRFSPHKARRTAPGRRPSTPYQRLGIPWPEDLTWEELLNMTSEQLPDKLSTAKPAA
jgi:hypothetical protein